MASSFKSDNQEIDVLKRRSKEKQLKEQLSGRGNYSNGNTAAPVSSSGNTATVSGRMYVVIKKRSRTSRRLFNFFSFPSSSLPSPILFVFSRPVEPARDTSLHSNFFVLRDLSHTSMARESARASLFRETRLVQAFHKRTRNGSFHVIVRVCIS